jgi:hypothetical protein
MDVLGLSWPGEALLLPWCLARSSLDTLLRLLLLLLRGSMLADRSGARNSTCCARLEVAACHPDHLL